MDSETVKSKCFDTFLLLKILVEFFMGIAVLYVASLWVFFSRFLYLLKINFVTKLNKTENFKKPHINLFSALNNIKREKYLKGSLFLKFFDICSNNPGI
jgi:hypothetical protein